MIEGVDYYHDDTQAPVARLATIRSVLAFGAANNMAMRQIDIRSAYLYGKLKDDEVIYMSPPPGYKIEGMKEGQVI